MAPTLCWLGLGNMGKAMSANLVKRGKLENPIVLWSRTSSSATAHGAAIGHAVVVTTAEEAVQQSDIVWSCVSDDKAVEQVFNVILEYDVKGKLFVECSTVIPEASNALCAKILAAGAEFVSMPVFGEPSMAAAGALTCVPAGKAESVAKIKPYLIGVIGRAVIDYSDVEVGKSSLLKVIGNVFIVSMIEALAEGHCFAEKTGLGSDNLEKFLEAVFPGPYMIHSKRMSSGEYHTTEPMVNITMARNLAAKVQGMAKVAGVSIPAYEAASKHMDVIDSYVGKGGDIDGIYGAVRLESGLDYELDKQ